MANPRKFSEKIALHNQKQAEETAAFEQIMREVSDATAKVVASPTSTSSSSSKHTLRINHTLGSFRGGSLPNVSAGTPAPSPQKSSSPTVENKKKGDDNNPLSQIGMTVLNDLDGLKTGVKQQRESRGRSVGGGPIRSRPIERKMDTSPYSSGPYLSPPPDTSWRRTNSDSALHQSAMHVSDCGNLQRRQADSIGSRWAVSQRENNRGDLHHHHHHHHHEQRPRSSCDVDRVPGIHIYPSAHEPGTIQIPIGNNTGSLPDLTNVHFPSPLNTPIDNEQDHSSSPYSSSPVSASPATLSPTSLPARQPSGRFQFSPGTPANRAPSPNTSTHQNHLSVPVICRYLHHSKGVGVENNISGMVDTNDYQNQYTMNNMTNMYQQQCSPPSPTRHPQQISPITAGYRSPQTRPSPQSSPGINLDGSRHSAPCSPSTPHSPSTTSDNYILNQAQAALLQHFEQCSMDWAQLVQSLVESGCTWTAQVQMDNPVVTSNFNVETTTTNSHFTQANNDLSNMLVNELGNDAGYFSTSPSALPYPTAPTSLHTTPNTPTSIPDIILTDFSNAGDELCRQELAKELGSAITGSLDSDLFPSDESLREGLGPIDFDGLQMLTDPELNVISDYAEDHFRQDRL